MQKLKVSDATQDMIDGWKQKHTTVKQVSFETRKGKAEFIVGKPTRSQLDAISKYDAENKPDKVREVLKNSCILAGDMEILEGDTDLQNAVFDRITSMFEKLEVITEKEL